MPTQPNHAGLLSDLDLQALGVAVAVAFVMGVLVTLRARGLQRAQGKPLSSWTDVLTDSLIGGLLGGFGSLFLARWVPAIANGAGILLSAALIAAFAPKITDFVQESGVSLLRKWLARTLGGAADLLEEGDDDDDKT